MKKCLGLFVSHGFVGVIGFTLGLYMLPILIAPPVLPMEQVRDMLGEPEFTGQFKRDLKDSDFLHWGEGTAHVSRTAIFLEGELAPGPDYKLYLSPQYLETEADFLRLKSSMVRVGDIKTFTNVIVPMSKDINPSGFNTIVVWCETFHQFITAAKYR